MLWFPFILASFGMASGEVGWQERSLPVNFRIQGAAADPGNPSQAYVWGGGLSRINLRLQTVETLLSQGDFSAPGCTFQRGLALLSPPDRLVWLHGRRLEKRQQIDTDADFADCLDATIFGRRGLFVTNRGLQVRFYEPSGGPWPYREIYSFYTASYQSGLIQADVDGDGLPDLFSGNYWIQSPATFHLPWRLFAVNTYYEEPHSAHLKLARIRRSGRAQPSLLVAQGEMSPGKLALFDPPGDVKQLWRETRLEDSLLLNHPRTLAVADFDNDGLEDFLLAEAEGQSPRVWLWRQQIGGAFQPVVIAQGAPVVSGWATDADQDGRADIVLIEPRRIRWLRNQPLK